MARQIANSFAASAIFVAGDRWRQFANRKTQAGRAIAACLSSGTPVPDSVLVTSHKAFFRKQRVASLFIVDGTPYSIQQFELICKGAKQVLGYDTAVSVIVLRGTYDVLRDRAKLRARPGENDEMVERRLNIYHTQQLRVVNSLASSGLCDRVIEQAIDHIDAASVLHWIVS